MTWLKMNYFINVNMQYQYISIFSAILLTERGSWEELTIFLCVTDVLF